MDDKTTVKEQKMSLRKLIRERIDALPAGELRREGEAAARNLRSAELWRSFPAILLFISGLREVDTEPLLDGALQDRKAIFAPKMEGDTITFYRIAGFEEWQTGPFGIREPAETQGREKLRIAETGALVIVPGAAFDKKGSRLGYGKGYYDRFFADIAQQGRREYFHYTGFCGEFQIVDQIPVEPWDVTMDALCTGREFRIVKGEE